MDSEPSKYHITKDETGKQYGRLTVLEFAGSRNGHARWQCLCECGNDRTVDGNLLRSGATKSCGCLRDEQTSKRFTGRVPSTKLPYGHSSRNTLLSAYKRAARKRGIRWEISDDVAHNLFSGTCFYCVTPPLQVIQTNIRSTPFTYNGIDRINNELGYLESNCVSCCGTCNVAKNNLPIRDFLEWLKRITQNLERICQTIQ